MLSTILASEVWWYVAILQTASMTAFWIIHFIINNMGMVDFGWPAGFFFITLGYITHSPGGITMRKALIAVAYLFCGLRFMVGWCMRTKHHWEDRRWAMWREDWKKGNGLFGLTISSVPLNSFIFYQAQALSNIFVLTMPVAYVTQNPAKKDVTCTEIFAFLLWIASFVFENIADTQLRNFLTNRNNKGKVCDVGLWKYSRHPNYFGEFLIWVSYAIFMLPDCDQFIDYGMVVAVPVVAYFFLVHFTGVPMTERGSLAHRGEAYADYMRSTSMIFPWFPKQRA